MKKALMHRNAAQRISRVRLRGRFLWMTLLGLAVLATVVVGAAWYRMAAPAPPTVSLSDLDPAVAAAIETAQRGVREQPRSGSAWGRLGMVLLTHDFPAEARICLTQAARFDPREPRWPYFQGIVLHQEEPDSAIPELQRAVELCGDEVATPRLLLAEILYAQGRRDEAEAQFQQVLHHEPGNARAHLGLGRLASWRGQGAECIRHLDAAKADPRTRKASLTLLAEVYQRLGDQRAADQVLRQLATLPDDAAWPDPFLQELLRLQTGQKAYLDRANRLLDQGHTAEAVALLQQAVREYPNADWTWLLLGKAFLKRKELPPAVEALRNAIRLMPDSVEAQFHLGMALFTLKDRRAAAACFRKVTELKPDAQAYYLLGHCLAQDGDRAGAIRAFQTALRYRPNYAQAHLDLGTLLAQQGQTIRALVHLQNAAQLDPQNPRPKKLFALAAKQVVISLGP